MARIYTSVLPLPVTPYRSTGALSADASLASICHKACCCAWFKVGRGGADPGADGTTARIFSTWVTSTAARMARRYTAAERQGSAAGAPRVPRLAALAKGPGSLPD